MITAAVRVALKSTLIIKVQLSLTNSHNHFTVVEKVRSDLSKHCVHLLEREGLGPVRDCFPISKYVVYKAVMAVTYYWISHFVFCINVCL